MPEADRVLFVFMLENALLKFKGQAFEDFFVKAGTALWGRDFEPLRAQGRLGDRKCDGYRISDKTVFQCYAPEQFIASKVAGKIQADFAGARDNFGNEMQKWVFVHNQNGGLPAEAGKLVEDLRQGHPTLTIEIWTPDDLIQQLLELSDSDLGYLFPAYVRNQNFSEATRDVLEQFAKKNRAATPGIDAEQQNQSNRLTLDDALDNLDEDDREIRRRILGYARWYDPANKAEIFEKMVGFGLVASRPLFSMSDP